MKVASNIEAVLWIEAPSQIAAESWVEAASGIEADSQTKVFKHILYASQIYI